MSLAIQSDQLKVLKAANQLQFRVTDLISGDAARHPEFYKWTKLAHDLIEEEVITELLPELRAFCQLNHVYSYQERMEQLEKVLDGAIDSVVVIMHLLNTLSLNFQEAWDEVQASNESKIDPATGKVPINPATGKWMKPEGFFKPDLRKLIRQRLVIERTQAGPDDLLTNNF